MRWDKSSLLPPEPGRTSIGGLRQTDEPRVVLVNQNSSGAFRYQWKPQAAAHLCLGAIGIASSAWACATTSEDACTAMERYGGDQVDGCVSTVPVPIIAAVAAESPSQASILNPTCCRCGCSCDTVKYFWIVLMAVRLSIWNYVLAAVYFCAAAFCDWRIGKEASMVVDNSDDSIEEDAWNCCCSCCVWKFRLARVDQACERLLQHRDRFFSLVFTGSLLCNLIFWCLLFIPDRNVREAMSKDSMITVTHIATACKLPLHQNVDHPRK
eukprot:SAG31_NODE_9537_length_1261_cov_0.910576_2_plen_268_part_00